MTPDSPLPPREELEAQLTAFILGELPADQAFALGQEIQKDPELAALYARLLKTVELVRETAANTAEQSSPAPVPLKMSGERREKLLAQFKTVTPREFVESKARRRLRGLTPLSIAAGLVGVIAIAALLRTVTTQEFALMDKVGDSAPASSQTPTPSVASLGVARPVAPDSSGLVKNRLQAGKGEVAFSPPTDQSSRLAQSETKRQCDASLTIFLPPATFAPGGGGAGGGGLSPAPAQNGPSEGDPQRLAALETSAVQVEEAELSRRRSGSAPSAKDSLGDQSARSKESTSGNLDADAPSTGLPMSVAGEPQRPLRRQNGNIALPTEGDTDSRAGGNVENKGQVALSTDGVFADDRVDSFSVQSPNRRESVWSYGVDKTPAKLAPKSRGLVEEHTAINEGLHPEVAGAKADGSAAKPVGGAVFGGFASANQSRQGVAGGISGEALKEGLDRKAEVNLALNDDFGRSFGDISGVPGQQAAAKPAESSTSASNHVYSANVVGYVAVTNSAHFFQVPPPAAAPTPGGLMGFSQMGRKEAQADERLTPPTKVELPQVGQVVAASEPAAVAFSVPVQDAAIVSPSLGLNRGAETAWAKKQTFDPGGSSPVPSNTVGWLDNMHQKNGSVGLADGVSLANGPVQIDGFKALAVPGQGSVTASPPAAAVAEGDTASAGRRYVTPPDRSGAGSLAAPEARGGGIVNFANDAPTVAGAGRFAAAGTNAGYDKATQYRLLAQLGADAKDSKDVNGPPKVALSYNNSGVLPSASPAPQPQQPPPQAEAEFRKRYGLAGPGAANSAGFAFQNGRKPAEKPAQGAMQLSDLNKLADAEGKPRQVAKADSQNLAFYDSLSSPQEARAKETLRKREVVSRQSLEELNAPGKLPAGGTGGGGGGGGGGGLPTNAPVPVRGDNFSAQPSVAFATVNGTVGVDPATGLPMKSTGSLDDIIPAGVVNYQGGASAEDILKIYGELVGRTILRPAQLPEVKLTFDATKAMTRREAIQILDAALGANGIAMVNIGEKFVKAVATPTASQAGASQPRQEPEPPKRKASSNAPIPQPEIQTHDNAFSTFSLNVSDVSFKLAAASLEKGELPDTGGIRSEEFINAFDYRDPEPPAGVPVAFAWERARYPFAQNRDLLRFSIKTAAQGRQAGRPLNIVLLLDNSGSMERADRVRIIREALRVLAAQLQPQDRLSVVTFARTPRLLADGVAGDQAPQLIELVSGLTPEGGTNLEEAMNLAYQTALRHYLPNGINRVVLLTDGAANLGNVDPETLKQKVEAQRKQGFALDCFGIGWEGYNDDLLEVLSRNGDGRYGFINTPEEAATEFAGQLAGALQVAASDVKVQVEFNPNRVAAYRQVGYAKHQLTKEQFRDNKVDAAEIGAAEAGNALYVIEARPDGEGPLAIVRVRFKIPGTYEYREHEWTVPYTGPATALEQSTPAMRLAATSSAFSEWLTSSPYAQEVSPDDLLRYLGGVPEVYGADARPKKLEWMIRQARSLVGK